MDNGSQSVSFMERLSSLRRLKCTSVIDNGSQSVSFMERLSSLRRLKFTRQWVSKCVVYGEVVLLLGVSFIRGPITEHVS